MSTKTPELISMQEHIKQIHEQAFRIEVEVLADGKLPSKANPTDAGFDVYATQDIVIFPGQVIKHPLNIRMKLPAGSWAQIETKSGLGSKGMLVYAGVVDEGYRGVPHVIATNLNWGIEWKIDQTGQSVVTGEPNPKPILVKKGEKLAQITMNPHNTAFYIEQVESVDKNTSRGEGGFGSTGA